MISSPLDVSPALVVDPVGDARSSPARLMAAPPAVRVAKPIVHVRVRPTLAHLGESPEQKRVWCLDQQNIVVRTGGRHAAAPSTPPPPMPPLRRRRSSSVPSPPPASPRGESQSQSQSQSQSYSQPQLQLQLQSPSVGLGMRRTRDAVAQPPRAVSTADAAHVPRRYSSVPRQNAPRGRRAAAFTGGFLDSVGTPRREAREDHFSFDFVHGEDATQDEVFEESVLGFAEMALLAQCIAIVCYGPTGSGKTYSMMGCTEGSAVETAAAAAAAAPPVRGLRPTGRGTNQKSTTPPIPTTTTTTTTTVTRAPSGGMTTDVTASPRSSGHSARDLELAAFFSKKNNNNNSNASVKGVSAASVQESNDTMGLLPRLVRVLLDRRGESVALDRVEPTVSSMPTNGTHVRQASGLTNNNGTTIKPSRQQQQQQQQQRLSLSLTLQEIMFYGVELYRDEFRDLLDPTKRPIPSIGDTGGLEAFCQRLNGAVAAQQQPATPRGIHTKSHRATSATTTTTAATTATTPTATGTSTASCRGGGILISSVDDLHRCYRLASRNRVTKSHQRNDSSSRSHALFILQLRFDLIDSRDAADGGAPPRSVYSYVAMVDLAGSERVKDTKVEGEALREAQYINKSLSALSAVLLALYQGSSHVPYRDSKLTRLLRPCFEGGRVLALVHVPPCSVDETVSALQFAEQVRHKSVRSHNLDDANNMLLEIFEDLIDPELHAHMEAHRQTEIKHAQLCADIRLAYLTRESMGILPPNCITYDTSYQSDPNARREGSPIALDVAPARRREYVIGVLAARHIAGIRVVEEEVVQAEIYTIEAEYKERVENMRNLLDAKVRDLQSVVDQQSAHNAQLAEENSQPVLRDAHAMDITQRLKEMSTALTDCVREKLLLTECLRAVRQRLTLQGDLERCIDDQLKTLFPTTGALGQPFNLQRSVSPLAESADEDAESRALSQQQILLARELSLLRQESTCFVRTDEVWEGLWARAMRQQMLVAATRERLLLERVALSPAAVRWALYHCGVSESVAADIASNAAQRDSSARAFAAIEEAAGVSTISIDSGAGPSVTVPQIPPLPITLGDEAVARAGHTLYGQRDDEAKLQTAAIDILIHDGIRAEALIAPLTDPATGGGEGGGGGGRSSSRSGSGNIIHNSNNNNNNNNINNSSSSTSSGDPFEMFHTLLSTGTSPIRWQSGVLRLCHPPRDASSYSLEFSQGERRLFSIPLGEPKLCISLHVLEEGEDPFVVLELRGVPPAATPGPMRLAPHPSSSSSSFPPVPLAAATDTSVSAATTTAASSASLIPGDIALARRLSCGGELVLPATAATPGAEGTAIALQFPAPRSACVEAVECIVAALAALSVPISGAEANASNATPPPPPLHGNGRGGVVYEHVPYVLLSGYKMSDAPCAPRVLGVSPLAYACTLHITFYFTGPGGRRDEERDGAQKREDDCVREKGEVDAAVEALHSLAAITLAPTGNKEATGKDADGNALLLGLQQIQSFRLKTRACMRQLLFDAEDIKAELLYSYSENEFMHNSHIRDVQREVREFVELHQSRLNSAPVSTLRVTPALCREMCGAAVPWTLWQWAYRWHAVQEADAQRPRPVAKEYNHDDDNGDSFDSDENDKALVARGIECGTSIFFEPLPVFLACMET